MNGRLEGPAWDRAETFGDFVELLPSYGVVSTYPTRAKVLVGEQAIYVGIIARDPYPQQIVAPLVRHDDVADAHDSVSVYLDPIGTHQSAQVFRVNAAGSTADGVYTGADHYEDDRPDFDFTAAIDRNPDGYTAVLRIPFTTLRFGPIASNRWRILVARELPREQFHFIASSPVPDDAQSLISTMQPLEGIDLPAETSFYSLRPGVNAKTTRSTSSNAPATNNSSASISVDGKWRPLPQMIVDGTINPDFSDVALDTPQLSSNTLFALYLTEKRPFFLESSDLTQTLSSALYTRSVTAPHWGVRSTRRDSTLAGTAMVIDDRGGGLTLLPQTFRTDTVLQPPSLTLLSHVRLSEADTAALQVGGLVAAKQYKDGRGNNAVAGPDVDYTWDNTWHVQGQWLTSRTSAQPDGKGGLAARPETSGSLGEINLVRLGERLALDITRTHVDSGFRNDSGFVNQSGYDESDGHLGYAFRQLGSISELWLNAYVSEVHSSSDHERVSSSATPTLKLSGPHNLSADLEYRGLSLSRTRAGGPLLHERYWYGSVSLSPGAHVLNTSTSLAIGQLADNVADRVSPGQRLKFDVLMRPFSALELEPSLSAAWQTFQSRRAYEETAAQLLSILHIDAQQDIRLILQRTSTVREPDLTSAIGGWKSVGSAGSLTYELRRSAGQSLYLGLRGSRNGANRQLEAFLDIQFDADPFIH